jgi:hydrophobic/amphiphilic exporter-1 (mainly G- bacteria), HAE1 family
MVGRVFREFAVTIAVAIIVSGFVSLTLTPMLCARVLHTHREGEKQNFVLRMFEAMFKGWLRGYEWSLDKVIAHKFIVLMITFATVAASVWLYLVIPKGFFPTEDTGFISASTEGASDVSFAQMGVLQRQVAKIVREDPAVDYVNSTIGAGGPNPTLNSGRMFIALKPKKERGESSTAVIQRLRRAANVVPGMRVTFQNVQNINITGRISKGEWQYTLQSSDADTLYRVAPEMREKIEKVPGLADVSMDLYIKNPQMSVEIDREKAAVYGITIDQVRQELFNAFGARQVATIYTPTNDYQVILESQPKFQTDASQLQNIFVKTNVPGAGGSLAGPGAGVSGNGVPSGQSIPLSAVTRVVPAVGPLQVNRQGNQPSVTISFNLAPGYSLGYARDAIREIERDARLPITINTGFQGGAQVFEDSLKGQWVLVLAAIFAAYVVLGILYESFIHPRPAVGRCRRAAGLDAVQDGLVRHCDDRHRDAGRHREEERDHDDRLRDRAAAGRTLGRSGDARGRPVALPSDHDDHVRRDLRHAAHRARDRRGRRAASAPRHRRGRRTGPVAALDPLHHAGGLHLSRPRRPHAQTPARAAAQRGAGARRAADRGRGGMI